MSLNTLVPLFAILVTRVLSLGQQGGPGNSVGEYGTSNFPPKPYAFNYEITDDQGNTHFRREQGDTTGTVSGSYGYMHINGLYRTVEYTSGLEGFKAQVKSNEPGVGGPGSADVQVMAEPVPIGLHGVPAMPVAPVPTIMRQGKKGRKL